MRWREVLLFGSYSATTRIGKQIIFDCIVVVYFALPQKLFYKQSYGRPFHKSELLKYILHTQLFCKISTHNCGFLIIMILYLTSVTLFFSIVTLYLVIATITMATLYLTVCFIFYSSILALFLLELQLRLIIL